jgi:hypothetical protein
LASGIPRPGSPGPSCTFRWPLVVEAQRAAASLLVWGGLDASSRLADNGTARGPQAWASKIGSWLAASRPQGRDPTVWFQFSVTRSSPALSHPPVPPPRVLLPQSLDSRGQSSSSDPAGQASQYPLFNGLVPRFLAVLSGGRPHAERRAPFLTQSTPTWLLLAPSSSLELDLNETLRLFHKQGLEGKVQSVCLRHHGYTLR